MKERCWYTITLESDFSSGFGCKFRAQGCVHPHMDKYSCLCVGSSLVTGSPSGCYQTQVRALTLIKAKTQNGKAGGKGRVINRRGTGREDGRPAVPQSILPAGLVKGV